MIRRIHIILIAIAVFFSTAAISQQIASGTYTFVNSVTPITVNLFPAGTISVTGLGGAITALNTYGVQSGGNVEFDFPGSYYEAATSQYSLGGSGSALFSTAYSGVIFKWNGTPGASSTMPLIVGAVNSSGGTVDYIVRLLGADNITFDGIDLKDTTANTTTANQNEFGYYLLNSGGNGTQNNTIKNCKVTLFNYGSISTQQNINSIGILTSNTDGTTTNSGNVFSYDTVTQAYNGVLLRGISTNPDIGCMVNNCVIGGSTAGSIGTYVLQSSGSDVLGLLMSYQSNFTVHDNIIQNCQFNRTASAICWGVQLANISGTNSFYKNQIVGVINLHSGFSSGSTAIGLIEGLSTDSIDIYNNFIGNIQNVSGTSSTATLFGIRVNGSSEKINLYHNSVYIPNIASSQKATSAALYVVNSTGATLNVVDNILKNAAQTSGSSKVYSFYFGSGNTLNSSNYNILDVNSGSPSGIYYTGNYLGTNYQTFANWQTNTGKDANSFGINAGFSTITSPVLSLAAYNANYQGIFITTPSITDDIFYTPRIYPIIGAYEPNFSTVQVRILNNNPSDSSVTRGSTQPLAGVALVVGGAANSLTSIKFTTATGSSYTSTDFSNIKLVWSTSNTYVGAVQVPGSNSYATIPAVAADNLNFTFPSLSLPIGTYYFFVMFDVTNPTAVAGHSIRVTQTDSSKFVLASGTVKTGDVPKVAQGGLQTVVDVYYNWGDSMPGIQTAYIDSLGGWYNPINFGPPTSFSDPNQTFVFIHNNSLMSGNGPTGTNWVVNGSNCKIIVGDPTKTASVTFNATDTISTAGTTTKIDVKSGGYLRLQMDSIPALGTMFDGGTVDYGAVGKNQSITAIDYFNLVLSGTGNRDFNYGTTGIRGAFTPNSYTNTNTNKGTISFDGTATTTLQQTVPAFTYWRLKTANTTASYLTPTLIGGSVFVDSMLSVSTDLQVPSGNMLTIDSSATVAILSDTLNVLGSLTNNNASTTTFAGTTTATLRFGANSYYNLSASLWNVRNGQIPAATWAANSTANITSPISPASSITVGAPPIAGFGNINFDGPALTNSTYYLLGGFSYIGAGTTGNPYLVTLQGNLTLGRTNSNTVDITNSGTGMLIFVGGNMTQNAGTYQLNTTGSGTGRKTITISGKDSINANYVYSPSTGYSSPVQILSATAGFGNVLVAGDFTMLGGSTISKSGSGQANLVFNGNSGNQNATFAIISGDIHFDTYKTQVSGGGDTVMLQSDAVADSFKLSKGVFSIGAHTLTINSGVKYPNPSFGGYIGPSVPSAAYGSGTGTIAGSLSSNLNIGSAGYTALAGQLNFATNTAGSPYNNYLYNFTLIGSSTATLGNALNIAPGSSSAPGCVTVNHPSIGLITASFLTLKSNSNGTARVGANTTSSTYISGNVTIERYIQAYRAWRLLTAPIGSAQTIKASWQEGVNTTVRTTLINPNPGFGTEITNLTTTLSSTGYDAAATNNPSLLYLNAGVWTVVPNTGSTNVNSQPAFMLFTRGSRNIVVSTPPFQTPDTTVLRTQGTIKEGQQTYPVASTGYQLFGNPYASELSLDNIFATYGSVIGSNYVMWDPLLAGSGTNGVGGYVYASYSPGPSYSIFNVHVSPFTAGRIESGAGFFFYAVPGTFYINESNKSTSSPLVFRPANTDAVSTLATQLNTVNTDGSLTTDDGTLNIFSDQYSDSVNLLEDAQKIPNPAENLGLIRSGKTLAIEKRSSLQAGDTIFLRLVQLKQGVSYRFSFAGNNINRPDLAARLEDTYKGTSTGISLTDNTTVDFIVTADAASQGVARFRIVFQNAGPLPVTYTNVKAWTQNANVNVQWNVTNELNINEYIVERSADGHTFTDAVTVKASGSNVYNWVDANATTGDNYYRIRSIGSNGSVQYSAIVKVKIGDGASSIAVYPNPVKGGVIGLQFSNMPKGIYGIRLLNTIGQQLYISTITHNGGNLSQQLRTNSTMAKGVYQLEITRPDKTKITTNLIVQ